VAAAKKEGRVTLYSPLIVDQVVRPLVAAFRAKYGIQVDFIRMDSDAVVLKVINEYRAHRATADVFTTSLGIEPLIASGALRKFRSANVDELPAQYKDPNGYWVADRVYVLEPAINTKLVPVSERPKSFEDLLDPKWAGKMAWRPANLTGSTGFIAACSPAWARRRDGVSEEARQAEGRAYCRERPRRARSSRGRRYPMALAMTNHNVEISREKARRWTGFLSRA